MTFPKPLDSIELCRKLAHAYADAVLALLRTGEPQGIDYDPDTLDFDLDEVEPGTSPTDVGLWVGERWMDRVGDIPMTIDRKHKEFSEIALRMFIIDRLAADPLFRKIALSIAADRIASELDAGSWRAPRAH
jgi:hypothetical protein